MSEVRQGHGVQHHGMDRRTMLKTAAAVGAGAVAWSAPRIETLGFAPAGAIGTPCVILSPEAQDKNSNSGGSYCSTVGTFPCCEDVANATATNFGNNGGPWDEWTFVGPVPGCNELVVRLVPLDCEDQDQTGNVPDPQDPSLARMGLVIYSTDGTCTCEIVEGVLLQSSGRVERKTMNNGAMTCNYPGAVPGSGVDISLACDDPVLVDVGNDARLAVRISCVSVVPGCTVIP